MATVAFMSTFTFWSIDRNCPAQQSPKFRRTHINWIYMPKTGYIILSEPMLYWDLEFPSWEYKSVERKHMVNSDYMNLYENMKL